MNVPRAESPHGARHGGLHMSIDIFISLESNLTWERIYTGVSQLETTACRTRALYAEHKHFKPLRVPLGGVFGRLGSRGMNPSSKLRPLSPLLRG
ncbi:hypothetical protein Taro_036259, partial [Colocasia esculenta]|nr:hypothetical protein [Colocasia esculenta]